MPSSDVLSSIQEISGYPEHAICLPLAPRVPLTDRLRELIALPVVQRLRGVRQLAFAHLVYPDATHSRFGHSLGVYYRTVKLLRSLLRNSRCAPFRDLCGDRELGALLVASVLHDAGHYPAAHSFEELIPRHDTRAKLLSHDEVIVRALEGDAAALLPPSALKTLRKKVAAWKDVTLADVAAILKGLQNYPGHGLRPEAIPVLHSILDGPFDVDKLDYVQRDSLHAGHPAGRAVDEDKLIDSLIMPSEHSPLAIDERGLNAVQSLAHARASMFQAVYWHRVNRCANRMFTEALNHLSTSDEAAFCSLIEDDIFRLDDEALVVSLKNRLPNTIGQLLLAPLHAITADRSALFQRVTTIAAEPSSFSFGARPRGRTDAHGRFCAIYDQYLAGIDPWKWLRVVDAVKDYAGTLTKKSLRGPLRDEEVLLDIPDARFETSVKDDLEDFGQKSTYEVYLSEGGAVDVRRKDPMFWALLENWRMNARKMRVFASPRAAAALARHREDFHAFLKALSETVTNANSEGDLKNNDDDRRQSGGSDA